MKCLNPFVSQVGFFYALHKSGFALVCSRSQSLRKSGRFLPDPRRRDRIGMVSGLNPFVSQVGFFDLPCE